MKRLASLLFAFAAAFGGVDVHAQAGPPANVSISFSPTTIAAGRESTLQIVISNPSSTSAVTGGTIASFAYASGIVNAPDPALFFSPGCGTPSGTATPGAGGMSASGIDITFFGICSIFINVTAASGGTYTTTFPIGGFVGSTGSNPSSSSATLVVNPPLVVTSPNDTGAGTLRQAILDANANCSSGPWTITFNIPTGGGPTALIQPATPLPSLSCANTSIDGYTEGGSTRNTSTNGSFNALVAIVLDGSLCSACDGLAIVNDGISISGLNLKNFGDAVIMRSSQSFHRGYLYGNNVSGNLNNGVVAVTGSLVLGSGAAGDANYITSNAADGVRVVGTGGGLNAVFNIVDFNTLSGINFLGVSQSSYVFDSFIVSNALRGISVDTATTARVVMKGNTAYGNGGPGIDLGADGATPNDEASVPYDTDSGPNDLVNYPMVTSVLHSGSDTLIQGYLKTAAPPSFQSNHVELWGNSSPSVSNTQGETFLTSFPMTLDANGFGTFSVTIPGVLADNVAAQVTIDTCGDGCVVSSEFSPTAAAALPPTIAKSFTPSSITIGGTSTLRLTIGNPNAAPATNVAIADNYPANMVNAAFTNLTNTCPTGSASSATPGASSAQWTGLSVPAGGSCAVSIDVTTLIAGTFTNTIAAGGMTSDQGSNASPVSASLTVSAAPAPAVTLNVSSLNFGSVTVGTQSATQDIVITNSGTAPLTIASAAVTGEFGRAASPRCDGVVLAPSATCTEKVFFAPLTVGLKSGTWSVTSDASGSPHSVSLSGQGVTAPTPAVSLSPTSLIFGSQTIGTTSAPQTVTLTNSGTGTLNISAIGTTGDFAKSTACPAALAPGNSCTIDVTFTPLIAGSRVGELKVFDDASGSPHVVALSGTGTSAAAPRLTLSASSLSFPDTFVGSTSAAQLVVVTNTGNAPLVIDQVGSSQSEFTFTTNCIGTFAPSASCDISVRFQPSATGPLSGSIEIFSNASGSPHALALSGTGTLRQLGILSVAPTSLAFPNSTVVGSQSAALDVTLTNIGSAPVGISSIAASANFAFSGACAALASGASCTLSVRFAPTQVGSLSGTLTIQSDATEPTLSVALSGRAVSTPEPIATLSATSLGFGNRFVGAPSSPQVITLTNTGLAPLNITGIFTTGDFTRTHDCPASLAPAASCQITVHMLARLPGGRFGLLSVFTNAVASPAVVELSGTGCAFVSLARARLGLSLSCVPGG